MLKMRSCLAAAKQTQKLGQLVEIQRWQTQAAAVQQQSEWQQARPFEQIPRPKLVPLMLQMLPSGKYGKMDLMHLMTALQQDFGNIFVLPGTFGRQAVLTTYNPKDFETVFRHEGIWPHRPGSEALRYHRAQHRKQFFEGVEGLIPSQGKAWGDFRSKVNPILMQPKNVKMYYKKMSQVNREFVNVIKQIRDASTLEVPANFEDYINRWTLESVSVVALDKQLGLLKQTDNNSNREVTQLFQSLNEFFEYTAELEMKPSLWRYIQTPMLKKLLKALDNIQNVTAGFVNEAVERLEAEAKQGVQTPEHEQSVLQKLLKVDKKVATVMAMDMLMAGVDTTTSTFTAAMLCIAKHADKQDKLREEVMRMLPHKDSEFTEESMKNVPYLRACIKESQRVYPLIVGNARTTAKDCVLSGYQVPAGTFISMISMQSEQYFPRGSEFLPERWLRGDAADQAKCPAENLKATNPFVFLPFGFGPRMCVGKRIVDMELELGLARLIRNFKIEFNYPTEHAFKSLLINMPNVPLQFKFTDIEN